MHEGKELNTRKEGSDAWKTPRRYHRRKGQDGSTPSRVVPFDVPFDVEEGKHDLLHHLITQEINIIREDIERALEEERKRR